MKYDISGWRGGVAGCEWGVVWRRKKIMILYTLNSLQTLKTTIDHNSSADLFSIYKFLMGLVSNFIES